MRFRFIKDVIIVGATHKKGEIRDTDNYDIVSPTRVNWCIGHGCLFPLDIGVDIEEIPVETIQLKQCGCEGWKKFVALNDTRCKWCGQDLSVPEEHASPVFEGEIVAVDLSSEIIKIRMTYKAQASWLGKKISLKISEA
jgi:hypothetical protein